MYIYPVVQNSPEETSKIKLRPMSYFLVHKYLPVPLYLQGEGLGIYMTVSIFLGMCIFLKSLGFLANGTKENLMQQRKLTLKILHSLF